MTHSRIRSLCFSLASFVLFSQAPEPQASPGLGDLQIAPTRVIFDARKRTAELSLTNIGTAKATYRVSLIRMEMSEDGAIREGSSERKAGEVAPEDLIRFSPREVTLGPREGQTVRLQVRKPAELAAGEYRVHLLFRAIPPTPEPNASAKERPKGLSIKLTPVYGISIPLIIRQGETSAQATITQLSLDTKEKVPSLRFRIDRSGNQSVYGDIKVVFVPKTGPQETLMEMNGVSVFVPNTFRRFSLPLNLKPGQSLTNGKLMVSYNLPEVDGGAKLAEGQLEIP
jgi:P pilus assembly chaperone PapD